jgi:hypothetical protein
VIPSLSSPANQDEAHYHAARRAIAGLFYLIDRLIVISSRFLTFLRAGGCLRLQ